MPTEQDLTDMYYDLRDRLGLRITNLIGGADPATRELLERLHEDVQQDLKQAWLHMRVRHEVPTLAG
jgi:hypothetical protein